MPDRSTSGDRVQEVDLSGALGRALVVFSPAGLVALQAWSCLPALDARGAWLAAVSARDAVDGELPAAWLETLRAYSGGEPVDPAGLPVDLRGPRFYVAVWRALLRVPRGAVRSYQGLASDAGSPRASRAVGQAMAHNPLPIVVPCHRAIGAGGAIGGYTGGLDRKRVLLALEGVAVHGDTVHAGQLDLL